MHGLGYIAFEILLICYFSSLLASQNNILLSKYSFLGCRLRNRNRFGGQHRRINFLRFLNNFL